MSLKSQGGQQLRAGSGLVTTAFPPGSLRQIGNFQSYAKPPYQCYTGMFGVYNPLNNALVATSEKLVYPDNFPNKTKISWDITPDPDWAGINGMLAIGWGNYDDSAGSITPRQLSTITSLILDVDWTFVGDNSTGLLCETWLTSIARPSGGISGSPDVRYEVGFLPKVSTGAHDWLLFGGPVSVGGYTDSHGVHWNVSQADNGQGTPYLIAYRDGYVSHQGIFDFKDLFTFLVGAGQITGNPYFNGLAFGAEVVSGVASLEYNSYTPTYTGSG